MKKAVSFILALVMAFATNFTIAFAAEASESYMPSEPNAVSTSDEEGIMPLLWDQFSADIPANSTLTLSGYSVYERYMAFESTATVMGGGTNSGTYSVELQNFGAAKAGHTKHIDGQPHKFDWIDLERTNNSCGFVITNHSSVDIHVTITFYSWS